MTEEDYGEILEHLRKIGGRAVRLDRYLMKRAWGVYYLIWATSILLFSSLPFLFNLIHQPDVQLVSYLVVYIIIVVVATYFTGLVFRKAVMLSKLEDSLNKHAKQSGFFGNNLGPIVFLALIVALVIIGSSFIQNMVGIIVETALLFVIDVYVYRSLKGSLGRVPIEGIIAVLAFGFSDIGSGVSVIVLNTSMYFGYFWGVTIVAWILASLYSFYAARDIILVEENVTESREA